MYIALTSIAVVILLVLYAASRYKFWRGEALKMVNGAYLPPPPSKIGSLALKMLGKLACFLFIGKVKVAGRKNARFDGHLLIVGNHQFQLDVATMSCVIPGTYRHLGKAGEMKNPIRGFLAAWTGHFAAKVEGGKSTGGSEKVIETCAQALAGSNLLLFPQGKLVYDNILRPDDFRTGAVRIAQLCAAQTGGKLAFLPVGIHYNEDSKRRTCLYGFMRKVGFKAFRRFPDSVKTRTFYGASVSVGKPVLLADLPSDPREATQRLRVLIQAQLEAAQNNN